MYRKVFCCTPQKWCGKVAMQTFLQYSYLVPAIIVFLGTIFYGSKLKMTKDAVTLLDFTADKLADSSVTTCAGVNSLTSYSDIVTRTSISWNLAQHYKVGLFTNSLMTLLFLMMHFAFYFHNKRIGYKMLSETLSRVVLTLGATGSCGLLCLTIWDGFYTPLEHQIFAGITFIGSMTCEIGMVLGFLSYLYNFPEKRTGANLLVAVWWILCVGKISYIVIYYCKEFLIKGRVDQLSCPDLAVFDSFWQDEWVILLVTQLFLLPLVYVLYDLNRDYQKEKLSAELIAIEIV